MLQKQGHSNLEHRFLKVKPIPLSTACYRIVSRKYDVLNTNGSLLYFGRYSNKEFLVLYTADFEELCEAELARKTKIKTKFIYKIAKLNLRLRKIIDLTSEKNIKLLNIQRDDLIGDNWDIPQLIAVLAYQKGYEGLLVPSATEKGNNIILFPDNFSKNSAIKKMAEKIRRL